MSSEGRRNVGEETKMKRSKEGEVGGVVLENE